MLIESASIQFNSGHQLQKQSSETETLRFWQTHPPETRAQSADRLDLSQAAQAVAQVPENLDLSASLDANQSLTAQIVQRMIKAITGRDFELFSPDQLKDDVEAVKIRTPPVQGGQNQAAGFGLVYQHSSIYQETENTAFSAQGLIKTRDGNQIEFSASLTLSRAFYSESNLTIRAGDAEKIDPLVINFDGNSAELADTRFEFDIDANGSPDQIAILKPGSGFLAFDKNRDGEINDGLELFGSRTGNGFSELAEYDNDHNGFIDEADSIYSQLRIWQRHEDGSQQLLALGDKNIGAIYLGHVSTPFQLRSSGNESLGDVVSTGIYLTEDGQTGSIQQIDFSV